MPYHAASNDSPGGRRHSFVFFAEDLASDTVELSAEETRHASTVRMIPGMQVRLTDGRGHGAAGILDSSSGRMSRIRITSRWNATPPVPSIHLFIGLPDREPFEQLLLDAAALGVSRITPLVTECSSKKWWKENWHRYVPRFRQKMIAAIKQSVQFFLPEIEAPRSPDELKFSPGWTGIIADPAGFPPGSISPAALSSMRFNCFVGPPGGFSPGEMDLFERLSLFKVRIAASRLRTELAATVLCAQLIGMTLGVKQ